MKKILGRLTMPLAFAVLALTVFAGCRAEIDVRRGRYYSGRVWGSDPYCYGRSYGCRYYGNDGWRMRRIEERRRWRWGRDWHGAETVARAKTWQSEFGLNNRAVSLMKSSLNQAFEGKSEQLKALGLTDADLRSMMAFGMPSDVSVAKAARTMGVKTSDLKDFLEVFLIRMRAAFEANERFE